MTKLILFIFVFLILSVSAFAFFEDSTLIPISTPIYYRATNNVTYNGSIGNCPKGYVVMNITLSGIQCVLNQNITTKPLNTFPTSVISIDDGAGGASSPRIFGTANARIIIGHASLFTSGYITSGEFGTFYNKASTGTCPSGQVVMNTTTAGVQCKVVTGGGYNATLVAYANNGNTAYGWGDWHSNASAQQSQINSKGTGTVKSSATTGYIPRMANSTGLNNSFIYQTGKYIGINTTTPLANLDDEGNFYLAGGNGDTNGDGTVTTTDIYMIKLYIANYTTLTRDQYARADVDGDGKVTMLDADLINGLIFGKPLNTTRYLGKLFQSSSYGIRYNTTSPVTFSGIPIIEVYTNTGNVGIGFESYSTSPQNKLDITGAEAIGASYAGTSTAPTNGLLVQGKVGIGTTHPNATLTVSGTAENLTNIGNRNFYINGTSGAVGIGTTTPATNEGLTVINGIIIGNPVISTLVTNKFISNGDYTSQQAPAAFVGFYNLSNPTFVTQGQITSIVGRGSTTSMKPIQTGDIIAGYAGRGVDTAGVFPSSATSRLLIEASENYTSTKRGSMMIIETTTTGTTSRVERMRIAGNGYIGINTATPTAVLDVNGNATIRTGGSAGKAMCWKADGRTLGYCSSIVDVVGGCTCN